LGLQRPSRSGIFYSLAIEVRARPLAAMIGGNLKLAELMSV
jgi:hypothetical protein